MLGRIVPHWYTVPRPWYLTQLSVPTWNLNCYVRYVNTEYIRPAIFLTHFPSSHPRNLLYSHSDLNTKDSWCIYRPSISTLQKKIPIKTDRINVWNELCNVLYILSHSSCFFFSWIVCCLTNIYITENSKK